MQSLEAVSLLNYGYETRWFDRAPNFAVEAEDGWLTVLGFFRDNPLQLVCQALGIADLSVELAVPTARDQIGKIDAIVARLRPAFRKHKMASIVARLQELGVLSAPILDFVDTLKLEQVAANGMIVSTPAEGQPDLCVIEHPLRFSRSQKAARKGPQKLGAQTRSVLAEFGVSADLIAKVVSESD